MAFSSRKINNKLFCLKEKRSVVKQPLSVDFSASRCHALFLSVCFYLFLSIRGCLCPSMSALAHPPRPDICLFLSIFLWHAFSICISLSLYVASRLYLSISMSMPFLHLPSSHSGIFTFLLSSPPRHPRPYSKICFLTPSFPLKITSKAKLRAIQGVLGRHKGFLSEPPKRKL